MKEDVISIILHAENDYHHAMEKAVTAAEKYTQDKRNGQNAYLEDLHAGFHLFEKEERAIFEEALNKGMREMDEENAAMKDRLKACQISKAGQISERLKREVLAIYGDS